MSDKQAAKFPRSDRRILITLWLAVWKVSPLLILASLLTSFGESLHARGDMTNETVVVYSGPIDWSTQRHTFATLQGIVNRDGPQLYRSEAYPFSAAVNPAWLDYYGSTRGFHYESITNFDALIARYKPLRRVVIGIARTAHARLQAGGLE